MYTVGVIYDPAFLYIKTVREHVEGFNLLRNCKVHFLPINEIAKTGIPGLNAVVHHYDIRLAFPEILPKGYVQSLKNFEGRKFIFIQDEYNNTESTRRILDLVSPDIVFTCVPQISIELIYPRARFPRTKFVNVLTGFAFNPGEYEQFIKPYSEREIDVGYRGRFLDKSYGKLGYDKWKIGEDVKLHLLNNDSYRIDISSREEDRIYGDEWLAFLGRTKASLGTESGSNVFDYFGEISNISRKFPKMDFETFYNRFLIDDEIDGLMNQISPRIFEAAAMKSMLVLFPGKYSGILSPFKHYLPLDRDLSNLFDILNHVQDYKTYSEITEQAHHDLIKSGSYSRESYYSRISDQVLDVLKLDKEKAFEPKERKLPIEYENLPREGVKIWWVDRDFPLKRAIKVLWRRIPMKSRFRIIRFLRFFS